MLFHNFQTYANKKLVKQYDREMWRLCYTGLFKMTCLLKWSCSTSETSETSMKYDDPEKKYLISRILDRRKELGMFQG